MDFLLEVGVYVLMVVFAAAGAGFVVFRLLTSGKGPRRTTKSKQGKNRGRVDEDEEEESEYEDTPPAVAAKVRPSEQQAKAAKKPPVEATLPQSVDSGSADVEVQSASNAESAKTEQQMTDMPAASVEDADNATGSESTAAGSEVEPGTIQEVLAPPDERNDSGDDDAFMAMFQGGDEEENTSGAIANRVEEVTLSDLLSDALQLTTTMKTRGGNDAQSE